MKTPPDAGRVEHGDRDLRVLQDFLDQVNRGGRFAGAFLAEDCPGGFGRLERKLQSRAIFKPLAINGSFAIRGTVRR